MKLPWTGTTPPGLGGGVTGAASSEDNAIARFDGATGAVLQNSTGRLADNGSLQLFNGSGDEKLRLSTTVPSLDLASDIRIRFSNDTDVGSGSATAQILAGSGTPEGAVAAPVGSLYLRTDGGASTTLYVKESGTGSTGWSPK